MTSNQNDNWPHRWCHLEPFLSRSGPFAHPEFEASEESLSLLQENIRLLVIGAGGLGCELLKDLALMGFRNIEVIDMDTIDLSNLNRQFLFRKDDIGKSKADVAAAFINNRVPGVQVKPHYAMIQDFGANFYSSFHLVVCGLDSILARRWINGMLVSLVQYDDEGVVDESTIVAMVDGGTEGFKGNARLVVPTKTPCIECTLDLYPPQVNFPMCTIAHTPRLPEHCIEYARVLLWSQEKPFGETTIDGDDPTHLQWLYETSVKRANDYGILGVTYRLTQGVVKRIIPAVASTNAVIAAACATECFKLVTSCCATLNNYVNVNDTAGVYTYTFQAERNPSCTVCSQIPQPLRFAEDATLQDVVDYLKSAAGAYQLRSPGLTANVAGSSVTLYMSSIRSVEEKTRQNLTKSLLQLGLCDGQEINVADPTSPNTLVFRLHIADNMDDDNE